MSYTKTTWVTGDTITAAKLNKMEDGIEAASGGSLANIKDGTGTGAVEEGLIGDDIPAASRNVASGAFAHVEGGYIYAEEGEETEYYPNVASGGSSHAEGNGTTASGYGSHAEGYGTTVSGYASHAEGDSTTASGDCSHAEGYLVTASGVCSHAEGEGTTASGLNSHAQNTGTIAQGMCQTAIGQFNVAQGTADSIASTDYAFIIGNGTDPNAPRSNALAVRWDGAIVLADGTVLTVAQLAKVANLT